MVSLYFSFLRKVVQTVSGPLGDCGMEFGCNGFVDGCDAARAACMTLGGDLTSIFNIDDNDLVYSE